MTRRDLFKRLAGVAVASVGAMGWLSTRRRQNVVLDRDGFGAIEFIVTKTEDPNYYAVVSSTRLEVAQ